MWVMQVIQEEFFHDSKQAVSRQVGLCQIVDLCMALQSRQVGRGRILPE